MKAFACNRVSHPHPQPHYTMQLTMMMPFVQTPNTMLPKPPQWRRGDTAASILGLAFIHLVIPKFHNFNDNKNDQLLKIATTIQHSTILKFLIFLTILEI